MGVADLAWQSCVDQGTAGDNGVEATAADGTSLGKSTDVDPSGRDVQRAADYAVSQLRIIVNGYYIINIRSIVTAQKQVRFLFIIFYLYICYDIILTYWEGGLVLY